MTGRDHRGIGSMLAGVGTIFTPDDVLGLMIMIVLTALALNTMMFLLMVRLKIRWCRAPCSASSTRCCFSPAARCIRSRRFRRGCARSRSAIRLRMRLTGSSACCSKKRLLSAVWGDMLFLSIFAAVTLGIAIPLFKRTL